MSVAQAIFPIFALILLGYGLRRWFRLSADFWPQLDRLIYYVFFPALLFHYLSGFPIDLGAATPMLEVAILYMLPAIAWGLASAFGLAGVYFHIAVLMAALPVSTVSYVLAMRMGGDGSISAAQVMVTTLLAMVTLPMWLLLMGF